MSSPRNQESLMNNDYRIFCNYKYMNDTVNYGAIVIVVNTKHVNLVHPYHKHERVHYKIHECKYHL